MKKVMLLVAILMIFSAGSVFASPVINGSIGAGEWSSGLLVDAFDAQESTIPDAYNLKRLAMILETSGGSTGLYILAELYGKPTFGSLDELPPIDPVFYSIGLDMNQNGVYTDLADRIIDYRLSGFKVYSGLGGDVTGGSTVAMGSVVEFYIPSTAFASFPDSGFNTFALLDNGGAPPDDRLPNEGTIKTPEPASMALVGMGLVGFVGSLFRKKFNA
jgi:PEP-CTERM putative exosortase interaction domain